MFLFLPLAIAESPSPLNKGAYSLYGSMGYGSWDSFSNGNVNSSQNLRDSINNTELFGSLSIGITDDLDISFQLPFRIVWAGSGASNSDDFHTTIGIGRMSVGTKILINPDGGALPFTLSMYTGIRNGSFHSKYRERVTNLGEGTLDVGFGLLAGKVGFLGSGFYWLETSGYYWHRQPINRNTEYPNDEISYTLEMGYAFHPKFGIASCTYGYDRLGGLDYPTTDADSTIQMVERWAALDASQIKTGLKINRYIGDAWTANVQFLYSVYAQNNPNNEYWMGIGVNYFRPKSI